MSVFLMIFYYFVEESWLKGFANFCQFTLREICKISFERIIPFPSLYFLFVMINSSPYIRASSFRVYYPDSLISDLCSLSVTGLDTYAVVTLMYVVVIFYTTIVSMAIWVTYILKYICHFRCHRFVKMEFLYIFRLL